ncbi:MAG: DUF1573 domain-containing protein [Bacteroidia bacterium]|nr:DUF1573 domain-containing protein [Bacteroidia bacterium]
MKTNLLFAGIFMFVLGVANAQDKKMDPAVPTPASMSVTPTTAVSPAAVNPTAGEFKFNEEEFNFGTIKQGESVTHEFTFVNSGKDPIIITSAQGSCGCTVPVYPKEPIAKGEKATIKVTFNSAGKMGMQDKTVTIQSNAKTNPKVIHIKGNVDAPTTTPETVPAAPTANPK